MYDVLIIGAGVVGALTARELTRYKLSVCFVDRDYDAGCGASRANSGIVHAGFDAKVGTLKAELNVRGCLMMPRVTEELDVEYKNTPSLVVCLAEEDMPALQELYERGKINGVKNLEIIDRERLRQMEPNISDSAVAALYAPDAGIVSPYELAIAAGENAVKNGADHYFGFKVTSIEKKDDYYIVSNGKQKIKARYIVNSAGLHSDDIAALTGDKDFDIIARRGEYMLFDKKVTSVINNVLFTLPTKNGKGILVAPTAEGNLLIGPNARPVDKGNTETTSEGLEEIHRGALALVPALPTLRNVIRSFAGQRPTPTTGDFIIRMSQNYPHVLHLAGIESPGLASSPAIAEYAVNMLAKAGLVLEKRDDFDPIRHSPVAFKSLSKEEKSAIIKNDPAYGKIICRCEKVTEGEIVAAINCPMGATSVDGVKRRTRAGMGRCQGGFCSPYVTELLAREMGVPLSDITKSGGETKLLLRRTK